MAKKTTSPLVMALEMLGGDSTASVDEAIDILKKESAKDPRALFAYARAKFEFDPEVDIQQGLKEVEAAANGGCGAAAYALFLLYKTGSSSHLHLQNVAKPDAEKRLFWFEKAFQLGHPAAIHGKARELIRSGQYDEALEVIKTFPEEPDVFIDDDIFSELEDEMRNLRKDIHEKVKEEKSLKARYEELTTKIAEGDIEACFILGAELVRGNAEARSEGIALLEKASKNGHHRAKHLLKAALAAKK